MTHQEIWTGIENLAASKSISCSRLAIISGLDPTSFNPSRHKTRYNKDRWPTTQTISRIMDATGITLAQFAEFLPSDTHINPPYPHFPGKDKTF